jgi:16S rRNA (guanine527-N7)-methyltransferase
MTQVFDAMASSTEVQRIAALVERLGLSADEWQLQQLQNYLGMLQRWNKTYNLTALRDPAQMFTHHLADCLAALPPLQQVLEGRQGVKLLDVGSGGGLPGVLIAVLCPQLQVTCVDTVGKKAAFIRQAAVELDLRNLRSEHARVERLGGCFDVITSRAFATLGDFVALTHTAMADGGIWMAMKGKRPDDEIAALPAEVDVFHVELLTVPDLAAERCLVWMRPRR